MDQYGTQRGALDPAITPRRPGRVRDAHRRSIWIAAGVAAIGLCIGWLLLPFGEWTAAFQRWMLELGPWGIAIFAAAFIAATLVLAPDWPLALAAGMVYGVWAIPVVLVSAMVAASLAFLAARYFARDRVRMLLAKRRRVAALEKAVSEEGWKIVILLRLSPLVPFNVQNYLFGITAIPFPHYAAATLAGIIPATSVFVYLGSLGNASSGPLEWAFFAVGVLATALVAVLVTRKARTMLAEAAVAEPAP